MARISSYGIDNTVTGTDKLLGTDSVTGQTKNFSLSSFSTLVSGTINVPGARRSGFLRTRHRILRLLYGQ